MHYTSHRFSNGLHWNELINDFRYSPQKKSSVWLTNCILLQHFILKSTRFFCVLVVRYKTEFGKNVFYVFLLEIIHHVTNCSPNHFNVVVAAAATHDENSIIIPHLLSFAQYCMEYTFIWHYRCPYLAVEHVHFHRFLIFKKYFYRAKNANDASANGVESLYT